MVAVAVLLAAACASSPGPAPGEVRVVGSDTMLVLNRRLAEVYMAGHPGEVIVVEGGGTGRGVEALIAGSTEVCAASRPLTAGEVRRLHERFGTLGVRFLVARDALSVYLNPANPVRDVSMEDLRGLFGGRIRSWRELGGADVPVGVVIRPTTSGTHHFFRDHVLHGEEYAAGATVAARTVDVVSAVLADPGAVGYGGVAYGAEVVHARIEGVAPTADGVRRGGYPLARYLTFTTVAPPRGAVRRFIDWCLADEGQRVVAEVGYVALWAR
jgi:phosphate transport system substrate-binding protein